MLGMARRAGKLSMGHDMALKAVMEHKTELVIFASDVSQRLVGEFDVAIEKSKHDVTVSIIPETITSGTAFMKDEYGWWGDVLYVSLIDNNVWTPDAYPSGWERRTE